VGKFLDIGAEFCTVFHVKRRKRRPWTVQDDLLIRQFHGEGKHDGIIAYILDRQRQLLSLRRHKLGLPPHKRPRCCGWKHDAAASAKMSEKTRQRWQRDRPTMLKVQALAAAKSLEARTFRRPPKGTPALKHYKKICATLGAQAARAALAAGEI
jgi:hypothetical protein